MILSIETATAVCGVAIGDKGGVLGYREIAEKNIHAEKLMPMIDELLTERRISLGKLDAIAVSIGPGSFTGLRIGLSTAKGMAMALRIPLIPVPTLDALALEALRLIEPGAPEVICPLIDARRDEVFFAFYRNENGVPVKMSSYAIQGVAAINVLAQPYGEVLVVGDGAGKFRAAVGENGSYRYADTICSPISVALLAERSVERLTLEEYSMLEPLYLREFNAG